VGQSRLLSRQAPAGILAPAGAAEPWFGALDAGGRKLAVIFAKEGDDDVLFVDRNADGKFGDGEKLPVETTTTEDHGATVVLSGPIDASLSIDGREVPGTIAVMRRGNGAPVVSFRSPSYLEATLEVGGGEHIVAVLDEDFDGRYGSEGDAWTLANAGVRRVRNFDLNAMGASSFEGGHRFSVDVSGDTVKVTVTEAEEPDPASETANRKRVEHIWNDIFDVQLFERAYASVQGRDTSRPTGKDPIRWNYVTFDEGLAMARESGKLLFVDAMAFWCVWCYALDYYTYPDDELAALMNANFVPVKIIDEQDRVGDYKRVMGLLEASSIPAMGIFDGDGNLVHKISGWKPPEAFIEDLKTAISKGWAGPPRWRARATAEVPVDSA
jgi:thiol-disulfide isomerase/thioredoxin